jgi:5-methylcytosine-specific restriction enzyme subunit McrC
MSIPIENIYYMLCYAWDTLQEREIVQIEPTGDLTELAGLFARVLINGLGYLRKKGMDRGFVPCDEDTSTIRGRIDMGETVRRNLLSSARVHCQFDPLSYNVLHNQIIKSTIKKLIHVDSLDKDRIKTGLVEILRWFRDVDTIPLSMASFRQVQLHRNNSFYRFLLEVCQIIIENLLISDKSGKIRFRDFRENQDKMNALFETFVRNFYRREQVQYTVASKLILWDVSISDEMSLSMLPVMRPDIVLSSPAKTIIIDAKYYEQTLSVYHQTEKVQSENLYQIFAYVKNASAGREYDKNIEGMLLYPRVGEDLNLQYLLGGNKVSIKTIDLNQNWRNIHNDLLSLVSIAHQSDVPCTWASCPRLS